MNIAFSYQIVRFVFALAALTVAGSAASQPSAPEKEHGITRARIANLDLSPEIEGMSGRFLRQNRATIEPGGASTLHDHVDLPEIIYVLSGTLTDYQGGDAKEYGPGSTLAAGRNTRHWFMNRGKEAVVLIATFISRPQ